MHVRSLAWCLLPLAACASSGGTVDGPSEAGPHRGPGVAGGDDGPMRFVPALYRAFDTERAMETLAFADGYFRAPGSEGYDATADWIRERLEAAGYGAAEGLELRELVSEMDEPAWTPVSAELALLGDGEPLVLHAFSQPGDVERVMLPRNAPSAEVEGSIVFHLEDVTEGAILVTEVPTRTDLLERASRAGAVAVLSASLNPFNYDDGEERAHLDSIEFRILAPPVPLAVCQISPRTFERLAVEHARTNEARVSLRAEVRTEDRPLRTVVAVVVGDERPDEAVVLPSHIHHPGASDNASGVAGQLESAVSLAEAIAAGDLDRPARSIVFLWGREFTESELWLEDTRRTAVAGISAILTGDSQALGGSPLLLERSRDPGAVKTLPPDEHTEWGAGDVDADALRPEGLAIVARCALLDVARYTDDGWRTADHPWEGGTDHDVFLDAGVPAVLLWHFSHLQYQTSLDRLEFMDPEEVRRTATVAMAAALAVADPGEGDLERYLASVDIEEGVRVGAAEGDGDAELVERWRAWCAGARTWLGEICGP